VGGREEGRREGGGSEGKREGGREGGREGWRDYMALYDVASIIWRVLPPPAHPPGPPRVVKSHPVASTLWIPMHRTEGGRSAVAPAVRGSYAFASQLNLSALYGIGGARRGCVARVKRVLGGVLGV
jgi:hypothetical protein